MNLSLLRMLRLSFAGVSLKGERNPTHPNANKRTQTQTNAPESWRMQGSLVDVNDSRGGGGGGGGVGGGGWHSGTEGGSHLRYVEEGVFF